VSSKFSPRLRKLLLKPDEGGRLRGLLEISPAADKIALRRDLERAGANIQSWSDEGHLVSIEIPLARVAELDGIDDVTYVEAIEPFVV
jgi:hypothetical protein